MLNLCAGSYSGSRKGPNYGGVLEQISRHVIELSNPFLTSHVTLAGDPTMPCQTKHSAPLQSQTDLVLASPFLSLNFRVDCPFCAANTKSVDHIRSSCRQCNGHEDNAYTSASRRAIPSPLRADTCVYACSLAHQHDLATLPGSVSSWYSGHASTAATVSSRLPLVVPDFCRHVTGLELF